MKITWKKYPSIPLGIEETFFNIINNNLVFSCGYNGGIKFSYTANFKDSKKNKYIRELKQSTYLYDLLGDKKQWIPLSDFPGIPRQGGRCVVINDVMYCYGGYKFMPSAIHYNKGIPKKSVPSSLSDGYSLKLIDSKWMWEKLPDIPEKLTNFGMTAIGNNIYICCGAFIDIDRKSWQPIVTKNNERFGYKLYRLDISELKNGWIEYDTFPGTLRMNPACTSINNNIYIIGGIYPNPNWTYNNRQIRFYNVLDNWKYNIIEKKWTKINLDIFNRYGNWGCSNDKIVYQNRYIILLGGFAYDKTIEMGKIINNKLKSNRICNYFIVYDTEKNIILKSNIKLFANINIPDYLIVDNKIYLIGGESQRYTFDNEKFGVHSDIFIMGNIIT